jgi:hypothetical protein
MVVNELIRSENRFRLSPMPVARARRMIVLISDGSYGITIAMVTSSTGLPVKSVTFCPNIKVALLLSMAEYCDIMRHSC